MPSTCAYAMITADGKVALGVRVEDTNWIKADGYETLTEHPRVLVVK